MSPNKIKELQIYINEDKAATKINLSCLVNIPRNVIEFNVVESHCNISE